jgi:hypothetical protein
MVQGWFAFGPTALGGLEFERASWPNSSRKRMHITCFDTCYFGFQTLFIAYMQESSSMAANIDGKCYCRRTRTPKPLLMCLVGSLEFGQKLL